MALLWRLAADLPHEQLPEELREILRGGWLIGPAESMLLKRLYGPGWRPDWRPEAVASYEYEANDVWVTDVELPHDRDRFLPGMVARARTFVHYAMSSARGVEYGGCLTAVISVGVDDDYLTHGTTVKFVTRRAGYPDYYADIERYRLEAIAVVEPHFFDDTRNE